MHETVLTVELPLNAVKDCYNLRLDGCPLMLTRQGGDYLFQVIWPEKVEFAIGTGESFLFRKENKLFFLNGMKIQNTEKKLMLENIQLEKS